MKLWVFLALFLGGCSFESQGPVTKPVLEECKLACGDVGVFAVTQTRCDCQRRTNNPWRDYQDREARGEL